MINARSPQCIGALPRENPTVFGEVDTEPALHEQQQGGSRVVQRPSGAPVAGRMDAPLHLHVSVVAHTFGRVD